ncbi:MAG: ABC transporter substrate-binding protein [Chloroflexi bacterium]|nr:ABC transporter substrate-binding protein [Chloroflexota bacterium]MCL5110682.1 ABC transporter substrate-binding protein [Chloroflexota bacterium]
MTRIFTRRDFLKFGSAAAAGLLAACAPSAQPAPTAAPKATEAPKPAATGAPAPAATQAPKPAATQAPAAPTKAAAGPKQGGTFSLGTTAGVQEFNPFNPAMGNTPFIRSIYNSLLHYDAQLNLQPELAEKYEVSADGKTVTLKLREGVKYHSGRDFTSADVKSSVDFASTNERSIMRALFKTIKQVETPDKYSVALKFDTLNPGMYDLLDGLYMIDKETIEDRSKTGIGTGPFQITTFVPNDRVEMVANKGYWEKGKPYLDKYIIRQVPDSSALSVNLESSALDCIHGAAYVDAARLKQTGDKFVVRAGPPGSVIYDVGMNVKVEPFSNKKVRQAIAWAIDRERFCKTSLQGFAVPTCLMWPSSSWAYFKELEGKIGFDLDKAKALLKEAGYEKGFDCELQTSTKTRAGYTDLATIMQADLKKIGINAKLLDLEPTVYTNRNQNLQMVFMTHAYGRANRDPGTMLTGAKAWYLEKDGGWTHIDSPDYERLMKDLNSTLDRTKRQETCHKIQEFVLDECFTVPVADSPTMTIYQKYVQGYTSNPDDSPFVGNVWLDK